MVGEEQGENCLVLNVLTPGTDDKKRPVLIYIHGGGFTTNSGSILTGGDKLVREQNIVAVSVNHRLNAFGFLYLGDLDPKYKDSGMTGMLDLVLALHWVQDNIAFFGGDPSRVTLMGESGGGMKISTLLAMKEAKGLFAQAIIESGSNVVGTYIRGQATQDSLAFLKRAGVDSEHLEQIQELPTETLRKVIGFGLDGYAPVADGIHLQPNPTGKFCVYPSAKGVPIMVGASTEELAAFVPPDKFSIGWEQLKEELTAPVMGGKAMTPEQAEAAIALFQKEEPDITSDHLYMQAVSMMSFLGNGAHRQADIMARESEAPVYHYLITKGSPYRDPAITEKRYAWHTADLPLQLRIVANSEQEEESKRYARLWGNFIRTGAPSDGEIRWPQYTPEEKETMVFGESAGVQKKPLEKIYAFFDSLE